MVSDRRNICHAATKTDFWPFKPARHQQIFCVCRFLSRDFYWPDMPAQVGSYVFLFGFSLGGDLPFLRLYSVRAVPLQPVLYDYCRRVRSAANPPDPMLVTIVVGWKTILLNWGHTF